MNILIIGGGHYSTGSTILEKGRETDKDLGVILPSVLELRRQGFVENIFFALRDGSKAEIIKSKIQKIKDNFTWDSNITFFPKPKEINEKAYVKAMKKLPKPGAVIIATPDYTHKEMIICAINNGLHYLVVKPVVTKLSDLKKILNLHDKKRVLGMVDYHKVFDEHNITLKNNYLNGNYGSIQHIYTKMTQRRDMLEIFKSWIGEKGHNINHYLGSHYIHLVGFLTKAKPLNVRAFSQYGVAKKNYKINTPDLIETQIEWLAKDYSKFISYHIAGWSDPLETPSMTYQEIEILTTKGYIKSDQRFRGFETVISKEGTRVINPYFFNLQKDNDGYANLESQYGFISIKKFIQATIDVENGAKVESFDDKYPTVKESLRVTAILQAADESLMSKSSVLNLKNDFL